MQASRSRWRCALQRGRWCRSVPAGNGLRALCGGLIWQPGFAREQKAQQRGFQLPHIAELRPA